MKKTWLGLLLAVGGICVLVGCTKLESFSTGDDSKWSDPNFKIIRVGAYNYTDYDIYNVYILPTDKNDVDFAGRTTAGRATPNTAKEWDGGPGNSPALAWDLRWKAPRKFKVWWHRVIDIKVFDAPGSKYDMYTHKETEAGSAWCEYEIEVKEQFGELFGPPFPYRNRNEMVLYFYPDGTVKGHLEFGTDSDIPLEDITKREQLPKLKDKACLKEIPNPFYGKRRPTIMN